MPDTPEPRAKRLSLSEVVELLLARNSAERSSVALTRNAKGETQIEVTVRSGETGDVTTAHDCARVARELYDELRAAYPPASAAPANDGNSAALEPAAAGGAEPSGGR